MPGDGCDDFCLEEPGYIFTTTVAGDGSQNTVATPDCGDGIILPVEGCDDSGVECCEADCSDYLAGFYDDFTGGCVTQPDDGITQGTEECDDGDLDPNDGCNANLEETGWTCT